MNSKSPRPMPKVQHLGGKGWGERLDKRKGTLRVGGGDYSELPSPRGATVEAAAVMGRMEVRPTEAPGAEPSAHRNRGLRTELCILPAVISQCRQNLK